MLNRVTVGLLSAFQAILVAVAGLAIPLVPLTLLWLTRFDLGLDWTVFYRAAADVWLLGHGVHLTITLDPALSASLGLPGADVPFLLSLAPLGFALLTLALALRLGRRTVEADSGFVGLISALVTFGVVVVLIAVTARHPSVLPTLWRSVSLPTIIFALGLIVGARNEVARSQGRAGSLTARISEWVRGLSVPVRSWLWASWAGGVGTVLFLVAVGGVVTALGLILNTGNIIGLYEGAQGGAGGATVLTLGQLAVIPNIAVWVAAWLVGSGFALGVGSLVSPGETSVGPLPAIPIFGIVPAEPIPGGYVWLVIPIVTAFVMARVARSRVVASVDRAQRQRWLWLTGAGIVFVAALTMAVVSLAAAGSIGPGRLSDVGPNPWTSAALLAVETAIGALLGLFTPGRSSRER